MNMNFDFMTDAPQAARNLLGYKLVITTAAGRISGYIVETEAYGMDDPASHSFRGETTRTAPMFGPGGTVYVYFTYGMHYCCNIVSGPAGVGQGALIRALEPVEGVELMRRNRGVRGDAQLTNGPAKLAQALGITTALSGSNIRSGPITLEPGIAPRKIIQTTRIGISRAVDQPWRFYVQDNPFVSRLAKR